MNCRNLALLCAAFIFMQIAFSGSHQSHALDKKAFIYGKTEVKTTEKKGNLKSELHWNVTYVKLQIFINFKTKEECVCSIVIDRDYSLDFTRLENHKLLVCHHEIYKLWCRHGTYQRYKIQAKSIVFHLP